MTSPATLEALRRHTGAARIALIPAEVLDALNRGLIPTVHLNEFLAVDLAQLVPIVAAHLGLDPASEEIRDTLAMLDGFKPVKRHEWVADALYRASAPRVDRDQIAHRIATHPSDLVRGWACHWVRISGLNLSGKLVALRRFALDDHFGVREMAWMAVRDEVGRQLPVALAELRAWVREPDPRLRRFAIELTRPRGVWCPHLPELVAQPWLASDLLEAVRADPSRYVQDAVANWLNDASKAQPAWVRAVCGRWDEASREASTAYITRRARRSLPV